MSFEYIRGTWLEFITKMTNKNSITIFESHERKKDGTLVAQHKS